MRESWTDERLDDLNDRVSHGFSRVDREIGDLRKEMNDRFDKVDAKFDKVDSKFERIIDRLDSIQRMIAFGSITLSGSFIAGFVVLATSL